MASIFCFFKWSDIITCFFLCILFTGICFDLHTIQYKCSNSVINNLVIVSSPVSLLWSLHHPIVARLELLRVSSDTHGASCYLFSPDSAKLYQQSVSTWMFALSQAPRPNNRSSYCNDHDSYPTGFPPTNTATCVYWFDWLSQKYCWHWDVNPAPSSGSDLTSALLSCHCCF